MGHTFAKMSNAFDGASQFEFSTVTYFFFGSKWKKTNNGIRIQQRKQTNKYIDISNDLYFMERKAESVCLQANFSALNYLDEGNLESLKELPMNILPDHRWTVKVIDPVNECHSQLLVVYSNCMLYERFRKCDQTIHKTIHRIEIQ